MTETVEGEKRERSAEYKLFYLNRKFLLHRLVLDTMVTMQTLTENANYVMIA